MLGTIGCVVNNLDTSINARIMPLKCGICHSATSILEKIGGYFKSIPVLLSIEVGHLPRHTKTLSAEDIDTSFVIYQNESQLTYRLAGYSVLIGNHFYSFIPINGEIHKFDGMLTPKIQKWSSNNFPGVLNTVFYILQN